VHKISDRSRRRSFLLGFAQSPVDFINAIIGSQGRDLRTIHGEGRFSLQAPASSDFFRQPWIEDAVLRYKLRHKTRKELLSHRA
jgi:SWI/SNF-related matrix-associated actin-dependent regulator of chromatin subfamily D